MLEPVAAARPALPIPAGWRRTALSLSIAFKLMQNLNREPGRSTSPCAVSLLLVKSPIVFQLLRTLRSHVERPRLACPGLGAGQARTVVAWLLLNAVTIAHATIALASLLSVQIVGGTRGMLSLATGAPSLRAGRGQPTETASISTCCTTTRS